MNPTPAPLGERVKALEVTVERIEPLVDRHELFVRARETERRMVSWVASSLGGLVAGVVLWLLNRLVG